jgi:hypothetical protein
VENKTPKNSYIVTYRDPLDSKVTELKANRVEDSSLGLTFVAVSDFVFEESGLVVDPAAEDLKRRFEGVKTLHLSLYSILSVQEVGAGRGLRFKRSKSNLVLMPTSEKRP